MVNEYVCASGLAKVYAMLTGVSPSLLESSRLQNNDSKVIQNTYAATYFGQFPDDFRFLCTSNTLELSTAHVCPRDEVSDHSASPSTLM